MANGSVITDKGKIIFLNRTYKVTPDYTAPTVFKVGINNGTPSVTSTELDRPVPISGTESVDDCEATTGWNAGTDSVVSLNSSTYKIGSGALNIYKTGTAGTVASASKTTTSRDFTSKDLHSWVYIATLADLVATGTAVTIRFGSDSSNYYYYDVNISSLSAGWNLVVFNSAGASGTTGSPTIAACDYYYIAFNTDLAADTIAAGDVIIDDLKAASADDYTKTYETGYPSIEEASFEVETQMFLNSVEANGYDLNSNAMFNTDSTPLMFSEDTVAADSKSNTDEFIYIAKDRVI